jgi:TnpA family transposase
MRDLKDQQLYRLDRFVDYGVFTPLLTKTADLTIVEEQWEAMLRVALSLKQHTTPSHFLCRPRGIYDGRLRGEFTTGDYEEIMNKVSCLSLVSNAILYWNTIKINDIVENLRAQGEEIDKETLSHISLLPFRHVVPNGTYFIEDV